MKSHTAIPDLISRVEDYLRQYVAFVDPAVTLPLALWCIGTFVHSVFDVFPYLIITSATKRSGKTRLSELLGFLSSKPSPFAGMTAATMFRIIEQDAPTIFFDESEILSREAASDMRAVLNVGYRQGQTIPRVGDRGQIQYFKTFCPKVFILIGDTYDTLRDRSIMVVMQRMDAPKRFTISAATAESAPLKKEIEKWTKKHQGAVSDAFGSFDSLGFLQDREEELWLPLFVLCSLLCPERRPELERIAVDMATAKTAESRRYSQLHEDPTQDSQYAERLLVDLYSVLQEYGKAIGSEQAMNALREIPTAPWRTFRGVGLRIHDLANMLRAHGVRPVRIAQGSGRGNQTFIRGYKLADVEKAVKAIGR